MADGEEPVGATNRFPVARTLGRAHDHLISHLRTDPKNAAKPLRFRDLAGAAHSALVDAMATGMRVAAGVALICAIGAVFAFPPRLKPEAAGLTRPASAVLVPAA
jgi:hypothetical protein